MKAENIEDIYELTPLQKGVLFHCLYENESQLYFFQQVYTVPHLNIDVFEKAWQILVARHTILRTGFYWEEIENPLQVVYKQVKLPLNQYDWRHLERVEQENRLKSFIDSDRKLYFDLSQPCLMRLTLIRFTDDYYQFIWSNHFIIVDGWSDSLILQEFVQIYEALSKNKEIPLAPTRPFRDYVDWLQQQDISRTETFWRQALQGVKTPTPLTYIEKISQSPTQEERYDEERMKLSSTSTQAIESFAIQHRLTLATILNGIWAILLGRYSRRNNILYGCTVTGRPVNLDGVESIAGVFVNTLPIYVKIDIEQPLLSWLQHLQIQLVETRDHEYTPLIEIHGWSEIPRNLTLFESFVVLENFPVTQFVKNWGTNLEIKEDKVYYRSNYPLNLVVYPDEELLIAFSYDARRFEIDTIAGILKDIEMLLQQLIINPNLQIKNLPFSTPKQQLITSILEKEALGVELFQI
ncbi:MAG: condensation domain-containing protein [Nostoc sp. DedQUE12b]|uniref:condensation domain-containing protein n=1 Tax=Nostoc sp. DedQUE12b TaxID=3075398 RepID=UPI002AD461C1|nr:condensation domain-containing protein [Nostoc sp. DedQUE12b]MDZ8084259.1 condensation domain-containing protein [Nostoc sp. DedQUE12b]